jgi:hypothetical protein
MTSDDIEALARSAAARWNDDALRHSSAVDRLRRAYGMKPGVSDRIIKAERERRGK